MLRGSVDGAVMRAEKPDGMLGPPCILASDALTSKQLFFGCCLHSRLGEVQICAFVTPASALLSAVLLQKKQTL